MRRVETYSLLLDNERATAVYGHASAIGKLLVQRLEVTPGRTPSCSSANPIGY